MNITIPNTNPPISQAGNYTFAMATAFPGTLNFNSNIATASFVIASDGKPTAGEERTFDGIDFLYIPAGSFMMGSETGSSNESPVHEVTITKGYWLGKYEVTQTQWENVIGSNPSDNEGANNPVEKVKLTDIDNFLDALGSVYRLPTEAEWEHACRAGSTSIYYFGDENSILGDYAWFSSNSDGKTHPVGQKLPNDWGLYDMNGNVAELCSDWYDQNYYDESPVEDPQGPDSSSTNHKVLRGGSNGNSESACTSTYRDHRSISFGTYSDMGFRLLREE